METVLLHIRKLRVDWLMFGAVIGLMLLGGAFVLSAAIDQYEIEPLLSSYFFRQLVFYGWDLAWLRFSWWWIIIAWPVGREQPTG